MAIWEDIVLTAVRIEEPNKQLNGTVCMDRVANILALLSTGLLAGAFAYGFFTVVPTFYEVPLECTSPTVMR